MRRGLIRKELLQQRQELAAVGLDIAGERAGQFAVAVDHDAARRRAPRPRRKSRRGDAWPYSNELRQQEYSIHFVMDILLQDVYLKAMLLQDIRSFFPAILV
ncbi:MAG: hypothetical protein AUH79_06055 [Betaproteobacteria bacterium 13_1_40CM_4_64_4]|nr:MAG: hypothetical protein AUH79_06055 [Betaproteobacteria bacterium 13_1_40CM_4_64_4]